MITTINYQDLVTMVNNYRTGNTNGVAPQHAPLSVKDISEIYDTLKTLNCDGVRIYCAMGDSGIKDVTGQDIMHTGFDGHTILIAVPTKNKVDDYIVNNTVTCFAIGVNPVRDNIGMCPPSCPPPGSKVI